MGFQNAREKVCGALPRLAYNVATKVCICKRICAARKVLSASGAGDSVAGCSKSVTEPTDLVGFWPRRRVFLAGGGRGYAYVPRVGGKFLMMSLLDILQFPDDRLRRVAAEVGVFDDALAKLAARMLETMYQSRGVGLAATQVDVHRRLFVADCADDGQPPEPLIFINPVILDARGQIESEEGCLSIPGVNDKVPRAQAVRVRAQNLAGDTFERSADGLLAVCIQHEIDHLDGKLFIDYLSPLKRQRIRKKLEKQARQPSAPGVAAR